MRAESTGRECLCHGKTHIKSERGVENRTLENRKGAAPAKTHLSLKTRQMGHPEKRNPNDDREDAKRDPSRLGGQASACGLARDDTRISGCDGDTAHDGQT